MSVKSNSHRVVVCLLALFTLLCTSIAHAKTWYVERWGDDTLGPPSCGKKTSPCLTIQFVLDNLATKNDRLVVGPGKYVENIVIGENPNGPLEGIKLESTAGRNGTIIETASPDSNIISIHQPRVQIGRKGKGFTLRGDRTEGFGISAQTVGVSRMKIEGNKVMDNFVGIYLRGDRNQVRGNIILDNWHDGNGAGIYCAECDTALIQDNQVSGNEDEAGGRGIYITGSTRFSVLRNLVSDLAGAGIESNPFSPFGKFRDNVVEGGDSSILIEDVDGSLVQGNIVSGGGFGMNLSQGDQTRAPQVKSNLVVDTSTGINLLFLDGGKIERNTIVHSLEAGINLSGFVSLPTFSYNNTTLSTTGNGSPTDPDCGIFNDSGLSLSHKKHFFGGTDDDECGPDDSDPLGAEATRPSALNVNRAKYL